MSTNANNGFVDLNDGVGLRKDSILSAKSVWFSGWGASLGNIIAHPAALFLLACSFALIALNGFGEDAAIGDKLGKNEKVSTNWVVANSIAGDEFQNQFRVDNVVRLSQNEREQDFKSSTVFYDDLVFDFVGDNGEIVVYSFTEKKFALLDPLRRLRTELDLDEIERFLERIRPILREKNDKFVNFMLKPDFEVSQKENEFFFQSKFIDYHIATRVIDDPKVAEAYFLFTNALGKLNVYMNPGSVTPFARLEANKQLQDDARFPEKIVTDVYPKGKTIFTKTVHITNEATLVWRLSERDKNRVNRTIHFFAQFPTVNFQTYFEKTADR